MAEDAALAVVMMGCGKFASRYHLPTVEADPAASLAAIFDPVPSDATRAHAARTGARLVAAPEEMPRPAVPTIAIISTPHALHAGHVDFALERGWHVLCDKPFVMHAKEARALADKAERERLVNAVAFNRRFDRGCLRARDAITAGAIGRVRFIETVQLGYEKAGWFLEPALGGGGPYTGRATHMADLIPWLIGARPTRLRSRVRGGTAKRTDTGGFIELHFGDLECHMTCIEEGWHMWDEVRVFGDEGLIELRRPLNVPLGWQIDIHTRRGEAHEHLAAEPVMGAATVEFFAAVRTGSGVSCSFREAVLSTEIVEEAFLSGREGGREWRNLSSGSAKP